MCLGDTPIRVRAGAGVSVTMEFPRFAVHLGVARACLFSITCGVGRRRVGPLACRGACRGDGYRFPRRAGVGARSAGSGVGCDIRRWPCWRWRSWRPRPGCAATPGSRPGRASPPEEVLARLGVRYRRPSEKTFRSLLSRLDAADLDRRLGGYFTAVAAARAAGEGGLLAVALDGKTVRGARRGGDGQRTWWRCSPTVPGWSSDSSPSLTRATKSPACECFSRCSRGCGCS